MAARLTVAEAKRLGVRVPRQSSGDLYLSDLPGPPGIERVTERDVQRGAVTHFRRALPPGSKVIAVPNQRTINHLPKLVQRKVLAALIADGMETGASDLEFIWDLTLGAPGNRGLCWVEVKRPVKPQPVSKAQQDWCRDMRAIGIVAGWAQSLEQMEALLVEAGAPLGIRLLTAGGTG